MPEDGKPTLSSLLGIYLNDHLAGAVGALELARRCAAANRENNIGPDVERLILEIEEDKRVLEDLMRRLRISPSRVKGGAAWALEKVARLKLNGRILSYSPLSRVLELEALSLGIEGKRELWMALKEIASQTDALVGIDLDGLIKRAEQQREVLETHREYAVARAFFRPGARGDHRSATS
jgi:hypothetical protein